MGFVVLVALGLYLLISIGVVRGAVVYARKSGKSAIRWGFGAALLMYLIPFWDWIPTVAMHRYYCATEAGFWIYKTPEQWKQENPGVMETLVSSSSDARNPDWPDEDWRGMKITGINQRFGMLRIDHLRNSTEGELFINVWRWQTDVLDKHTGEVLARQVDFSSGNGNIGGEPPLKFWLQSWYCNNNADRSSQFNVFLNQIKGAKK